MLSIPIFVTHQKHPWIIWTRGLSAYIARWFLASWHILLSWSCQQSINQSDSLAISHHPRPVIINNDLRSLLSVIIHDRLPSINHHSFFHHNQSVTIHVNQPAKVIITIHDHDHMITNQSTIMVIIKIKVIMKIINNDHHKQRQVIFSYHQSWSQSAMINQSISIITMHQSS